MAAITITPAPSGGAGTLLAANNLSDVANAQTARINIAASTRLTPTATKTGAYTAVLGDLVACDATAGALTITLPAAAPAGGRVTVKKLDSTANAVTVAGNGADVIVTGPGTTAATAVFTIAETREFIYDGAGNWFVASGNVPRSALDSLYAALGANAPSLTITYTGGAYAARSTVTVSTTTPVTWVGPVAPPGALAVDIWENTGGSVA